MVQKDTVVCEKVKLLAQARLQRPPAPCKAIPLTVCTAFTKTLSLKLIPEAYPGTCEHVWVIAGSLIKDSVTVSHTRRQKAIL